MDFTEPISYPLKDLKKLIIGGLLFFPGLFLLLIPAIIALGYTIKVAGDTVRGKNQLPEFDEWEYFLIKGIGYIAINFLYICVMFLLSVPAMILYFTVVEESTLFFVLGIILGIMIFIAVIALMFIMLIALIRYGEKEKVGAAFEFKENLRNLHANLGSYIIGYIVLMLLSLLLGIFQFILQITVVGIFLIGIIYFYYYLVMMRMFAQIYKESNEKLGKN